jgi:hypothetical protein
MTDFNDKDGTATLEVAGCRDETAQATLKSNGKSVVTAGDVSAKLAVKAVAYDDSGLYIETEVTPVCEAKGDAAVKSDAAAKSDAAEKSDAGAKNEDDSGTVK